MASRTELYASDTHNDDGAEATNITATTSGTKRALDVALTGADGITDVDGNPIAWDTIAYAEPTASSETYTYSLDGTDLVVYTVSYTDATKETLAATAIVKSAP